MPLTLGARLGHYDVTSLLGEGGMGQVWQATDTALNRQVALKILPDAFAEDPERLARFRREAQIETSRGTDLYVHDLRRGGLRQLTFADGFDRHPAWTTDSRRIMFSSDRHGLNNM